MSTHQPCSYPVTLLLWKAVCVCSAAQSRKERQHASPPIYTQKYMCGQTFLLMATEISAGGFHG